MSSVKIILRQKQSKDGLFPLAVRITKDRKTTYIYLGQSLAESQWDEAAQRVKKSHPNSARLNNFILKKLAEANDTLLELQTQKEDVSSRAVKQSLKPKVGVSFAPQAEHYLASLKLQGKYVQFNSEQSRIKRFQEFLKGRDLAFSDITVSLLENYRAWLVGTRNPSERTIINHLMSIRAVFSQAMKEHPALEKYYPFGQKKGITLKFPESLKVGLTVDEVKRIEALDLKPGSPIDHARNLWLISFYFAGMRTSDVLSLRWSDFHNDRLHYSMGKNNKPGTIKISDKAAAILNHYKPQADRTALVFPDLRVVKDLSNQFEVERRIAFVDKSLNEYLKKIANLAGIEKNLSMHIARHTFGNIAGDKIPVQMLQKLYRHSSILTTIGYQANFIHKESDDAIDAVTMF
jgi:integrase/recombinase XerD